MRLDISIVGIATAILALIPLPIFWRARNIAVLCIIGWLFVCNMFYGINAIIWADTVVVKFAVWCDIGTKLSVGSVWAIPALMLCLCRYLADVASSRTGISGPAEKRKRMILELIAGVGLPIIGMALHYTVQGHRFDIDEDFGCVPAIYMSIPAVFIIILPPILFATGTAVYAGMALVYFIHRRKDFLTTLRESQSGLSSSAYFRLITIAVLEMIFTLAMTIFDLVTLIRHRTLLPWISWEWVHSYWFVVSTFPTILRSPQAIIHQTAVWHMRSFASLMFFVFFGCGQVANAEYRKGWVWIQRRVFRIEPTLPNATGSTIAMPTLAQLELDSPAGEKDEFASSTHTASRPSSPGKPTALNP